MNESEKKERADTIRYAGSQTNHPVVEAEYRFTGNKIRSEVFQITLH